METPVAKISKAIAEAQDANTARADRARLALMEYADTMGVTVDSEGIGCMISDLLSDIRHLCDDNNLEFGGLDDRAYNNYCEELFEAREETSP